MFFGKKTTWRRLNRKSLNMKKMRSNFAKFKELGVTDEHRATAIAIIERNKPNMALNAETLKNTYKKDS